VKRLALLLVLAAPARADVAPCGDLGAARSSLRHNQVAKQPEKGAEQRARDAWAAVEPRCRDGAWYLLAANLLRAPGHAMQPLVAGDVTFTGARDALAAGLAAQPRDADLLAYVAYLARIAPDAGPPLPDDACTIVHEAEPSTRAYVCTVQALLAGRRADAAHTVDAIVAPRFPDVVELRALAHAPSRKLAPRQLGCDPFCPSEGWRVKR
jgi:hypothetical protein